MTHSKCCGSAALRGPDRRDEGADSSSPLRPRKTSTPFGGSSRKTIGMRLTGWREKFLPPVHRLAKHPRMGTKRQDITPLPVRFWTVTRFPKLRDRLSPRNCPVASGRRSAREVRPERGSGNPVLRETKTGPKPDSENSELLFAPDRSHGRSSKPRERSVACRMAFRIVIDGTSRFGSTLHRLKEREKPFRPLLIH